MTQPTAVVVDDSHFMRSVLSDILEDDGSDDQLIGVIPTGMGQDGAAGIESAKAVGGKTVAQDEETSAVFGMPKRAIETGAVDDVLAIENIAEGILEAARAGGT